MDLHTATGKILGDTATNKNIIYINDITKCIKIATHCIFDEAGITLPPLEQSPAQKALQQAGYRQSTEGEHNDAHEATATDDTNEQLIVKLLSEHATKPKRSTPGAAGYDVFSAVTAMLQLGQRGMFPLDIQLTLPDGTYIQIKSRSSISIKNKVDIQAGVIDADFTGNMTVILHDYGPTDFHVNIGDEIAQILLIRIETPNIHVTTTDALATQRRENGFGSTDAPPLVIAASLHNNNTEPATDITSQNTHQ